MFIIWNDVTNLKWNNSASSSIMINKKSHEAVTSRITWDLWTYKFNNLGGGGGDPHFTTWDGLTYTYNGLGEFDMSQDSNNQFKIQCRTSIALDKDGNKLNATVYSAVGVYVQGGAHVFAGIKNDGKCIYVYDI